jgi:hypothetical protein
LGLRASKHKDTPNVNDIGYTPFQL